MHYTQSSAQRPARRARWLAVNHPNANARRYTRHISGSICRLFGISLSFVFAAVVAAVVADADAVAVVGIVDEFAISLLVVRLAYICANFFL